LVVSKLNINIQNVFVKYYLNLGKFEKYKPTLKLTAAAYGGGGEG
jgi:hypothetical protein